MHVHVQHRWSPCVLRSGTCPTTYMALVVEMPSPDPAGHTPLLLRCAEFVHVCVGITFLTRVSAHQSRLRETFQLILLRSLQVGLAERAASQMSHFLIVGALVCFLLLPESRPASASSVPESHHLAPPTILKI